MKFKAKAFTSLLTLSCLSTTGIATEQDNAERWFEIEVILFTQLNDKSELKEQFADDVSAANLPQYQQSFDLLSSYLQPNLSAIKQLVPLCNNAQGKSAYELTQKKLTMAFPTEDSFIQQANAFTYEPVDLSQFANTQALDTQALNTGADNTVDNSAENTADNSTINADLAASRLTTSTQHTLALESSHNTPEETSTLAANTDITSATASDATTASNVNLVFDWQTDTLNSALFSTTSICAYQQEDFEKILNAQQLANFSLDGFSISSLDKKLNAAGAHVATSPYLISDDNLLLKEINTRLAWSKEFRPLLHFGWRQIGITQKQAIPLKLYAGHHFENDYQQALQAQQEQQHLAQQQAEQNKNHHMQLETSLPLSSIEVSESQQNTAHLTSEYIQQAKQKNLQQLFTELAAINNNEANTALLEDIITQLSTQSLEDLLTIEKDSAAPATATSSSTSRQALEIIKPPVKPLQPWFLDGFFKVHLDHYLYITADFNILSKELAAAPEATNGNMKLINFSQNKRVITGEIHYFDHPYIGMIVQIRRFDPTKPAEQAVSQAIR